MSSLLLVFTFSNLAVTVSGCPCFLENRMIFFQLELKKQMRKNVKVTATSVSTIGPETVTARFENVKTRSKEDIVYTELGTYEGIKTTNYKTDGNIKLSSL